jgi:hypothetical protein
MSGGVVFWQGGPLSWTAIRQDQTALSSGKAEIRATNKTSKSVMGMRHLAKSVRSSGYDISDTVAPSPLYNENAACIQWAHNMTSKKIRHMELWEKAVREWVHDGILNVLHVKGRINPADIFTKEMRDGAHFRRLRDSFMCQLSNFLHQLLLVVHHSHSKIPTGSASSGILSCVFNNISHTKFLFCSIVFFPLMSDSLSHFSSIKCGSSSFASTPSYCSIKLFLLQFSWTQGWGVLFHDSCLHGNSTSVECSLK